MRLLQIPADCARPSGILRSGVRIVANKYKKNKGNKYLHQDEFAEEVLAKNSKQPAQNNPAQGVRK
jgi:hypothetical protein